MVLGPEQSSATYRPQTQTAYCSFKLSLTSCGEESKSEKRTSEARKVLARLGVKLDLARLESERLVV